MIPAGTGDGELRGCETSGTEIVRGVVEAVAGGSERLQLLSWNLFRTP